MNKNLKKKLVTLAEIAERRETKKYCCGYVEQEVEEAEELEDVVRDLEVTVLQIQQEQIKSPIEEKRKIKVEEQIKIKNNLFAFFTKDECYFITEGKSEIDKMLFCLMFKHNQKIELSKIIELPKRTEITTIEIAKEKIVATIGDEEYSLVLVDNDLLLINGINKARVNCK